MPAPSWTASLPPTGPSPGFSAPRAPSFQTLPTCPVSRPPGSSHTLQPHLPLHPSSLDPSAQPRVFGGPVRSQSGPRPGPRGWGMLEPDGRADLPGGGPRCLLPAAGPGELLAPLAGKCRAGVYFLSARTSPCVSQLSKCIFAAPLTGRALHAASTHPAPRAALSRGINQTLCGPRRRAPLPARPQAPGPSPGAEAVLGPWRARPACWRDESPEAAEREAGLLGAGLGPWRLLLPLRICRAGGDWAQPGSRPSLVLSLIFFC